MTNRIKGGVHVKAYQRANEEEEIEVQSSSVHLGIDGKLTIAITIGDKRRNLVKAMISLDEILAWLPDMTESAKEIAAKEARQELIKEIRQEGYRVTTMPSIKVTPISAA